MAFLWFCAYADWCTRMLHGQNVPCQNVQSDLKRLTGQSMTKDATDKKFYSQNVLRDKTYKTSYRQNGQNVLQKKRTKRPTDKTYKTSYRQNVQNVLQTKKLGKKRNSVKSCNSAQLSTYIL